MAIYKIVDKQTISMMLRQKKTPGPNKGRCQDILLREGLNRFYETRRMTLSDRVARSLVSAKINHWLLFFFFIRESHGGSDFERHFVMKNCIKIFLNTLKAKKFFFFFFILKTDDLSTLSERHYEVKKVKK